MAHIDVKPEINPDIIGKLGSEEEQLWFAAHADGSDNRINGDTILEASTYGIGVGLIAAGAQWIRRRFRNRGKTRDDLAAEKEAARINRTSGALKEMLLEYFQAAQDGSVDEEALDELIATLEEMQGYYRSGKLQVPGEKELAEMQKSIAGYTDAIAESKNARTGQAAGTPAPDAFSQIREQLIRQKELIGGKDPA